MSPLILPAIVTLSLGRPEVGHDLHDKIRAAKKVGFLAIEISYFCLEAHAKKGGKSLHEAAKGTRALLDELELEAVSLSPLMNFEGVLDRSVYAERLKLATVWLELAHILRAPLVQVPASMLPISETSPKLGVADLVELTDLAAQYAPPICILYEFTSWSTYFRTWQGAIEVAKQVDRPNFSICLDAFHIGTYLEHENSAQIPAPPSYEPLQSLTDSMKELVHTRHASKFVLYQLTDAAPVPDPLPANQPAQDPTAPKLQTMSRTNRPYPFTEGGLLPLVQISRAVLEMQKNQTKCIWSMETFVPRAWSEEKSISDELAQVAWLSWTRMKKELGL
ncbi:xylose isomerase-like protein [Mycena capillaripes]|nr:xylose isomerase-like protein [Mycena capillaripes]